MPPTSRSKRLRFGGFLVLMPLLFCFCTDCPAADLRWPQITRQTKPWSRWWWMGNIATPQELTAEMEKYAEAGLGGLEITPIYGVKGYEDRFTDYLSPAWMNLLVHALGEGARLDMGIDMATGNGWPFGGPWIGADFACRDLEYKTFSVQGGERLDEPVTYVQEPMVRAIGGEVQIGDLKEPISSNENLQALALEQVKFAKPLPLQVLMAYSDQGQTLNLTARVGADGRLDWTAPPGNWTLYAVFQGWHGKMVERAGPGGEGNVIDHFSADALRAYLRHFDDAFEGYDMGSLRAYFNDSYEVDDASGESNWTTRLFDEFQKRRGYDLRSHLPALFGQDEADTNVRVLCDYRETISDLLLEEFTIPWGEWAKSKGALTRNQAHGSPANILDLYAASGIPETEGSEILRFKSASSAAHVTGKPLASAEAATWLDEHFRATLGAVKQAVDLFFLGGINHICYHGTTFSPPNEAWPGWMFYASVHFGPTNSFWNDFSILNDYVARVQSFLQMGRPANDVLLYSPIYDRWSEPGRSMLQHFEGGPQGASDREVAQAMLDVGYTFDFVSDRQITGLEVTDGALESGGNTYRTVVLPETNYIPLETFRRLIELARGGATVAVYNALPADVPGWGNLDERRKAFQELTGQLRFTALSSSQTQEAEVGGGRILVGNDIGQLLADASIAREPMTDQGLQFVRRDFGDGRVYFVVNGGDVPLDGWVPLRATGSSASIFEPMQEQLGVAAMRRSVAGFNEVYLQLAPGESRIVRTFDDTLEGPPMPIWRVSGKTQPLTGSWTVRFLDGGPQLPGTRQTAELGSWTDFEGDAYKAFSGTARYSISFLRPSEPAEAWLLDLGRVVASARVRLNGRDIGGLIQSPFQLRIPADLLQEQNTLEVAVSNLMGNRISDLDRRGVDYRKFYNINFPARLPENRGPDGNFSAAAWPPQASGLLGPVTLTPLAHPPSLGR